MADNTTLNTMAGGDIISSDVITTLNGGGIATGEKAQRMKVGFGSDGSLRDVDANNGLPMGGSQSAVATTSWTSATAGNTANTISVLGMNTVTVAIVPTTTFTGGVISFEVSPDNTNWFPITMARIDSYTVESTYTIVASTNRAWSTSVDGFTNFRVRLSTVITGTGTLTTLITAQAMPIEPIISVGQATAANLNGTMTLATGSATIGALTANQSVNAAQINGVTPLMGNGVTGTGSLRTTIASDNTPFPIKLDQTTPGTTNATSLAQIGATTVASGNGVAGAGVQRVAIASDNTSNTNPWLVNMQQPTVGTITSVTGAAVSTTILASNASRKGASVYNDSTAILYLSTSATAASTTVYSVQVPPGGYYELPNDRLYTGQLTGIWASATGAARVTELT